MKKLLAILLFLICLTALVSCSYEGIEIPDGMQLVDGSDELGYYFFAPEGWMISNLAGRKAAYVSTLNTTSVSFVEVSLDGVDDKENYFFNSYFTESLPNFDEMNIKNFQISEEGGTDILLGAKDYQADRAKQYIYSYDYPVVTLDDIKDKETEETDKEDEEKDKENTFTFRQILAMHNGKFYILTYAAINEEVESLGGINLYTKYLEEFNNVIENFRFVDAVAGEDKAEPEYEKDADGFKLISDKKLSGFDFYVPDDFTADFSSAIVSASHADGSSVNMTEVTSIGANVSKYWELRKTELANIASDLKIAEVLDSETGEYIAVEGIDVSFGPITSTDKNAWAKLYEYTFKYNGTYYHVYQVLVIYGFDGYTFTYTATEENYLTHLDTVKKIIEKVRF